MKCSHQSGGGFCCFSARRKCEFTAQGVTSSGLHHLRVSRFRSLSATLIGTGPAARATVSALTTEITNSASGRV